MTNKALSPQGSHISVRTIVQAFSQSRQRRARVRDHDNSILKLQGQKTGAAITEKSNEQ